MQKRKCVRSPGLEVNFDQISLTQGYFTIGFYFICARRLFDAFTEVKFCYHGQLFSVFVGKARLTIFSLYWRMLYNFETHVFFFST